MKRKFKLILTMMVAVFCVTTTANGAMFDIVANAPVAENHEISFAAVKGSNFTLSCTALENRLGVPKGTLLSITITGLPDAESALLKVGERAVIEYEELDREEIDMLCLSPQGDAKLAKISFIPSCEGGRTTIAAINLLDSYNNSPTAESGTYTTTKNTTLSGKIPVFDPEGDMVKITLTSKPQKGVISFDGISFIYRPFPDVTGEDRFTFVASDMYGNTCKESFCEITIEKQAGFNYTDMNSNPSHYAAIKLAEKGVYAGEKMGNAYFLMPDKQVTRGEFLIALIASSKLEGGLTTCINTGLANDHKIPLYLKPYVKLALERKIISSENFVTDEIPTRAEAVILVKRAVALPDVETTNPLPIPDVAEIPSWALGAYIDLHAYKMLDLYDDYAYPNAAITRDYMVDLIWQAYKYSDVVK